MATYTEIHLRRDSTLNWYASNPRLALGEPGIDLTLHRFKIGNGIDRWNELPYMEDDLYKLLDKHQQETADKVQDILNKIAANKLDADTKYNAATTEIRNTSRDLNSRMTAVEDEQEAYEAGLTKRQDTYEAGLTGEFTTTKQEVHEGLEEFNETRDRLTTRMDAIAGQATEDTEILDARVDAEYQTHPNLGHNIRNIHSKLLEEKAERLDERVRQEGQIAGLKASDSVHEERLSELLRQNERQDEGLLQTDTHLQRQIDAVSEAELRTAANLYDLNERRRAELIKEEQARTARDTELQRQVTANALGLVQESRERTARDEELSSELSAANEEAARQRKELDAEKQLRNDGDEGLQRQIDVHAEATIRTTFELYEQKAQRRAELSAEKQERIAGYADLVKQLQSEEQERIARDEDMQRQIDKTAEAGLENTASIQHEAEQRRKFEERISERIIPLEDETVRSIEADEYQQEQIDNLVVGVLNNALTLCEVSARRRAALLMEELARFREDANLQAQIDTNAAVNLELSLNLQHEGEARRKFIAQVKGELQHHLQNIQALLAGIDEINNLTLPETQQDIEELYREINANTEAIISVMLQLQEEAVQRRKVREELSAENHAEVLQERQDRFSAEKAIREELDTASTAILETMLNVSEGLSRQRAALSHEVQARAEEEGQEREIRREEDGNLQSQLDRIAEALMRQMVKEHEIQRDYSEVLEYVRSIPDRPATDDEFDEMLDELYKP